MKRLITYLVCATFVVGTSYASQESAKLESKGAEKVRLLQFDNTQDVSKMQRGGLKVRKNTKALKRAANAGKLVRPLADDNTPVTAPFMSAIDSEEELLNDWTIINANGDIDEYGGGGELTWTFADLTNEIGRTVAILWWNDYEDSDDYMVTKRPVTMKQGKAYFSLDYGGYAMEYYESLELLYGTSPDVESMTKIQDFIEFEGGPALSAQVPFEVPTDGDYYFAIHGISPAGQYAAWVDNILIDNGEPAPDITLNNITLPTSSSSLTANEQVGVTVVNSGKTDIASYSLTMTVTKPDGTEMTSAKQTVNETLSAGASKKITLDATADLSVEGTYVITITAGDVADEVMTANNSVKGNVIHMGVTDVPFETNFADGENSDKWTSDGSWIYVPANGAIGCAGTGELMSMGVNLEAGKSYRFAYTYYGNVYGIMAESYNILCGLEGEDKEVIYQGEALTSDFEAGEVTYNCKTSGVYQFAFSQDYPNGTFFIQSVSVTEIVDYDLGISYVADYPTMLPVSQAGQVPVTVAVANLGSQAAGGSITVTIDGVAGAPLSLPADLAAGDAAAYSLNLPLTDVEAGKDITVEFAIAIDGQTDQNAANDKASITISVTDNELAYDQVTEDMCIENNGVGSDQGAIMAATSIHIVNADELTGVSIGWAMADGQPIKLAAYKFDPSALLEGEDYYGTYLYYALGEEVFSIDAEQGSETGFVDYTIDPVKLEAGDYLLCVEFTGFCITTDRTAAGSLYSVSPDYGEAYPQTGFGAPAIRALLGDDMGGVDDIATGDAALRLYPNPASETLIISGMGIENVSIWSMAGAQVGSIDGNGSEVRYDVSGLASGVYFAKVKTATGTQVMKFVVK